MWKNTHILQKQSAKSKILLLICKKKRCVFVKTVLWGSKYRCKTLKIESESHPPHLLMISWCIFLGYLPWWHFGIFFWKNAEFSSKIRSILKKNPLGTCKMGMPNFSGNSIIWLRLFYHMKNSWWKLNPKTMFILITVIRKAQV